MKRGYYVLIAGAGIFAAGAGGAAYMALLLTGEFERGVSFVEDLPLEAGQSKTLSRVVTNTAEPLSILLIIHPDTDLDVVLIDPEGRMIVDSVYSRTLKDFEPTVPGTYTLVITNNNSSPTVISASLQQAQVLSTEEANLYVRETGYNLLAVAAAAIAGVITMIAGAILIVVDKRKSA